MRLLLACFIAFIAPMSLHAQPAHEGKDPALPAIQPDGVLELETMTVTGVQPGPGMWKVSKGDHTLWILGTLSPLPNNITWLSRDVDAVLDQSQQILGSPGLIVGGNIGVFKGLTLLPSAMKAMKNPDDAKLQEVLPADLYARWLVSKKKYLGNDNGVEKKRPIVAANELYSAAIRKAGIGGKPVVSPVIQAALKRRKLKLTSTQLELPLTDPRQALKEIRASQLDDIDCFRKTLARVESDLPLMVERANAWSIGDLEALRALPVEDQQSACLNAVVQTSFAQKRGLVDIQQQVEAKWLATAEAALQKNQVTFATLPISLLLKPEGYLARLRAKGYVVEEP